MAGADDENDAGDDGFSSQKLLYDYVVTRICCDVCRTVLFLCMDMWWVREPTADGVERLLCPPCKAFCFDEEGEWA